MGHAIASLVAAGLLVVAGLAFLQYGLPEPGSDDLIIDSFYVDVDDRRAVFSWTFVPDEERGSVSCSLNVDGDGIIDYVLDDCHDGQTLSHEFDEPGPYVAYLVVRSQQGGADSARVDFRIR